MAIVAAQTVHFLTFSGLPLLLPLVRDDLGIGFAQAGLLSVVATLAYAAAQIPAGLACDRQGAKGLFLAGLLGWSLLAAAFAGAWSYPVALLTLSLAGACRALLFAPGLSLMVSCFSPERRATAMSLYLVGSFVGTIAVSMTAPSLSAWIGWRGAFALYAALGVATAIAFARIARPTPRRSGGESVRLRDLAALLESPLMWACNVLQFIRFAAVMAFNFWLPSLLVSERGFSLQAAGGTVALAAIAAAAANPLGGYLSDRLRNPPVVIGGSLAVVAFTSSLLPVVESVPVLLAVIGLHSICMTIYFGPLFHVPVEALGTRTAGITTGMGNLFANLGALAAAYALGLAKDVTGSFATGFYALAGVCIAGVALSALLARLRSQALRPARGKGAVAHAV